MAYHGGMFALAAIGLAFALQTDESFPDNPRNHWAYEGLSYLKSQGLLVGYPDGLGYPRPKDKTRYELAVSFHAAGVNLRTLTWSLRDQIEEIATVHGGSQEAIQANLKAAQYMLYTLRSPLLPRALDYLKRGGHEFAPEMKSLGASEDDITVAIAQYQAILPTLRIPEAGSALKQFPDVPAGHWAAKAVLDLRESDILQGYPDGRFGG